MRTTRDEPRTFSEFPVGSKCPVCGTNDDGKCVLIAIDGTSDGSIAEGVVVHLACAIPTNASLEAGLLYRRFAGSVLR